MSRAWLATGALTVLATGCATVAPLTIPAGPWVADAGGAAALESATSSCRGVRTLTAEIAVRGQVGPAKIRGRVIAGLERGGSIRLEAPAPFGAPIFILSARANRATLWLPRDRRILRDAPVDEVLDAIAGLHRSSDDLLGLLAGCLTAAAPVARGDVQRNPNGWLRATLQDATVAILRRDGSGWRVAAGHHDAAAGARAWTVGYEGFATAFPDLIRISGTMPAGPRADLLSRLTLQVSQRETNAAIDARAFDPLVAPDATPITVDQLRQAGPLADRTGPPGTGS